MNQGVGSLRSPQGSGLPVEGFDVPGRIFRESALAPRGRRRCVMAATRADTGEVLFFIPDIGGFHQVRG